MTADVERTLLVGLLVASAQAVEPDDRDLIFTPDGESIRCQVLRQDPDRVIASVQGQETTFYRSRIIAVALGQAAATTRVAAVDESPTLHRWDWELLAGAGPSIHIGRMSSSGAMWISGSEQSITMDFNTNRPDALPSMQVRTQILPEQTGARPILGAQVSSSHPTGDGINLALVGYELLTGLRWDGGTRPGLELLVGGGWLSADCRRNLVLQDSSGVSKDRVEDVSALTGWILRGEGAVRWNINRWSLGLATGASVSQLSGSTSWDSSQGIHGTEHLSGTFLGLYATGQISIRW